MTKLHKSAISKKSLFETVKFKTMKTGPVSKTPFLEMGCIKTGYFEKLQTSKVGSNSFMTKFHKSAVSKMSLIQSAKFRTWRTGLFKISQFEILYFQMEVFENGVTVVPGLSVLSFAYRPPFV